MRYRRGASAERELIHELEARGFAVVRSAGSKKVDVVAGNGKLYLCIEVKSTRGRKLYLKAEDLEKLLSFSARFGCVPVVAVKFVGYGWRFFMGERIKERAGGGKTYPIGRADPGVSLETIIGVQRGLEEVLRG